MNRKILSTFAGYCAHLDNSHTIQVEFAEISILGQVTPGYKKMGYRCNHSSDCKHLDQYGACELYYQINSPV